MTLTGQVFTLMSGIATEEQARGIVRAASTYLYDDIVGGYRLNTDFGGPQPNLGRCFGFAFGHKENGAMFSHMAVMYANALYRRGFVQEGYGVLEGIYRRCEDFPVSRIYPGLPEYVNQRGRGMYPWLTGSASWYLLTLLSEAYGVKGVLGDLVLEPRLLAAQFDAQGLASVRTQFAGRDLVIVYHNPRRLEHGAYGVRRMAAGSAELPAVHEGRAVRIAREVISALPAGGVSQIDVELV
jgi:hypothetical protein